jgi:hypothetical protein
MGADYTEYITGHFAENVHEVLPISVTNTSGQCICTAPVGNQGLPLSQNSSGILNVTITGGIVFTLQNLVKGVLPVASSFDIPPTNLANVTDGNVNTVTGTGTSTGKGAFGTYGIISFDLGSVRNVLIGGKVGLWSTIGTSEVFVQASTDHVNYYPTDPLLIKFSNVEEIGWLSSSNVVGRYIEFVLISDSNTTVNMKIYQLMVYDLGSL